MESAPPVSARVTHEIAAFVRQEQHLQSMAAEVLHLAQALSAESGVKDVTVTPLDAERALKMVIEGNTSAVKPPHPECVIHTPRGLGTDIAKRLRPLVERAMETATDGALLDEASGRRIVRARDFELVFSVQRRDVDQCLLLTGLKEPENATVPMRRLA